MEQFASLNKNGIRAVGVGTLDDRSLADDFQNEVGAENLQLVWSDSRDVWDHYDVSSQHTTILLDASGDEIDRWTGFSAEAVSAASG